MILKKKKKEQKQLPKKTMFQVEEITKIGYKDVN